MGLNETLDRLAKERDLKEAKERQEAYDREIAEMECMQGKQHIAYLAERVFFQRMLKDINNGMGEPKIDAMIDRSVMIATKLYNKLYK